MQTIAVGADSGDAWYSEAANERGLWRRGDGAGATGLKLSTITMIITVTELKQQRMRQMAATLSQPVQGKGFISVSFLTTFCGKAVSLRLPWPFYWRASSLGGYKILWCTLFENMTGGGKGFG